LTAVGTCLGIVSYHIQPFTFYVSDTLYLLQAIVRQYHDVADFGPAEPPSQYNFTGHKVRQHTAANDAPNKQKLSHLC
jgi:hypothetical protein